MRLLEVVSGGCYNILPLVEFAYNNALSATTSVSPFFANKGYHLNSDVHPKCDIASFSAHDFTIDLNELQSTLKPNNIIRNLLMCDVLPLLISK